MKKNFTLLRNSIPYLFFTLLALTGATLILHSQVIRGYGIIYSNTIKGGHTMFGNTILARDAAAMNEFSLQGNGQTSNSGNDDANMQFVDVDGTIAIPQTNLFDFGSDWSYYTRDNSGNSNYFNYNASNGPGSYTTTGYSQTGTQWDTDPTPLRFNTGTGGTTLGSSNSSNARTRNAYYFRKSVNVAGDPALYTGLTINVRYDDAVVVYVNGTEVGRADMASGAFTYTTNASSCNTSTYKTASFTISPSLLVNGTNIISAEVHQGNGCSGNADMYFDMSFAGTVSATNTFNSSSADLILPAGSNSIKYARLYWGGRISSGDSRYASRNTVKIRKGASGPYQTITAPASQIDQTALTSTHYAYQGYFDVTNFINAQGAGTYTVADIAVTAGSVGGGGYYGGWSLVVVYENNNEPFRSVRLYDGFLLVEDGATQTINLTGLNAPGNTLVASDAYMTAFAWEGDANLAATSGNPLGDFIKVNGNVVANLPANPSTNMWNGTISKNGVHVTTKNPDYKNQMGIDIDELQVGNYNILPNSSQVTVEFGTEADQYFPSVFAFSMLSKDPTIYLDKSVSDATFPFNIIQANEILTYTLSGANIGDGAATGSFIVDTLPAGLTYVPNSLEFISSPGIAAGIKTDAQDGDQAFKAVNGSKHYVKFFIGTGATGSAGGTLLKNESYSVRFKVQAPYTANALTTFNNTARLYAYGESSGIEYTDDGTAFIGPQGSSLPVKLGSFTVKKVGGNAQLDWLTVSETKNDRFDIERSTDGVNFTKMGSVDGAGTTTDQNSYQYTDVLSSVSAKVVYYRLRTVDFDGKSEFSKIVALHLDGNGIVKEYTVYPNPFTSNIKLNISSARETNALIRITNTAGQVMVTRSVNLQPGDNIVVLKDLDVLPKGIHLMEVISEDGKLVQKILKK